MKRLLKNTLLWCLLVCWGGLMGQPCVYAVALVEGIDLDSTPGTLQIGLSERAAFKVVKLDARQIMVAFRSADISSKVTKIRSGDHLVTQVKIEMLPDGVVSLMIDTAEDITDVQAEWQDDSGTLLVRFVPSGLTSPKITFNKRRKFPQKNIPAGDSRPAEAVSAEKTPADPGPSAEPSPERSGTSLPLPVISGPTAVPASEYASDVAAAVSAAKPTPEDASNAPVSAPVGIPAIHPPTPEPKKETGLDGLIAEISRGKCSQSPLLKDALALGEQKEWNKLFDLLGTVIDPNSMDVCQADLYYLRAFAAYKMNRSGSEQLYLDAANYFQDAASYFPDCPYTPYGLLALASIYNDMNNYPEAKGYYNIILKSYADHPVSADALFHLGNLYLKKQKQDQAIIAFRKFIEEYPHSSRLTDARLALGKCLYETNEFTEALTMLRKVVEEDPQYVYKDPDLLVYTGYLNFQLGDIDSARDAMIKAVNLYPERDAVPDLLTRIADTLKDDNRIEQAKKVYQLVMERYPGTDGFAISAVRYAGLLSERVEKEAQYQMVIKNFPGHPMAKLAVIRLADLQSQAGEYGASIDTLRGLMSGDLKDLRNEAAYAMASSFDGFFRQLTAGDDPIAVISAYEKDKHAIDRLDNPDIFEMIGTAFFKARLYRQAAELFQESYKLSSPDNRTVSLYYLLGVTFQELGKNMQAKEMFDAYFQKIPNEQVQPDACLRMGRLLMDEKAWESALTFLRTGFKKSESDLEKADFLLEQADAYQGLGNETKAPGLLIAAINLMASSPEVRLEHLMQAHRSLGESYLKLSENDKAIDAFTMALKFSKESRPPGLLFLLAESNMKAHRSEAAKEVFLEIVNSGDGFWGRMAQERLRTMELEVKLKES